MLPLMAFFSHVVSYDTCDLTDSSMLFKVAENPLSPLLTGVPVYSFSEVIML